MMIFPTDIHNRLVRLAKDQDALEAYTKNLRSTHPEYFHTPDTLAQRVFLDEPSLSNAEVPRKWSLRGFYDEKKPPVQAGG
jgi:hypothetical protein